MNVRKTFGFQCKMSVESKYKGSLSESVPTVFSMFLISAAVFSHDIMKKKRFFKKSKSPVKACRIKVFVLIS